MLTTEQEKSIHSAAVKFAIEHYQDDPPTKGSVILSAAEMLLESDSNIGPSKEVIDLFAFKINRTLKVLTYSSSKAIR
jgi:hypothetical protein